MWRRRVCELILLQLLHDHDSAFIKLMAMLADTKCSEDKNIIKIIQPDLRIRAIICYLDIPGLLICGNEISIDIDHIQNIDKSTFALITRIAECALVNMEIIDRLVCTIKYGVDGKKRFHHDGIVFSLQNNHGQQYHDSEQCLLRLMQLYAEEITADTKRYIIRYSDIFKLTDSDITAIQHHCLDDIKACIKVEKQPEVIPASTRVKSKDKKTGALTADTQHAKTNNAKRSKRLLNKSNNNIKSAQPEKDVADNPLPKSAPTVSTVEKNNQASQVTTTKPCKAPEATTAIILSTLANTSQADSLFAPKVRKPVSYHGGHEFRSIRTSKPAWSFRQFHHNSDECVQSDPLDYINTVMERIHAFHELYNVNSDNLDTLNLRMIVYALESCILELGDMDAELVEVLTIPERYKSFIRNECQGYSRLIDSMKTNEAVIMTSRIGADIWSSQQSRVARLK